MFSILDFIDYAKANMKLTRRVQAMEKKISKNTNQDD